ncbi:hypothetical protein GCM10022419_099450 [Nonomuraea rosea]|uniref:Uncharacterized protein n=1 Tax=Nonomuraea rosea TaxID=638574 RepID=A0ABP6Z6P8_9ACTN
MRLAEMFRAVPASRTVVRVRRLDLTFVAAAGLILLAGLIWLLGPGAGWVLEHVDGVTGLSGKKRAEALDAIRGRGPAISTGLVALVRLMVTGSSASVCAATSSRRSTDSRPRRGSARSRRCSKDRLIDLAMGARPAGLGTTLRFFGHDPAPPVAHLRHLSPRPRTVAWPDYNPPIRSLQGERPHPVENRSKSAYGRRQDRMPC